MSDLDARKAGMFVIGGDIKIARLGYGALRVTGDGHWGPPPNKEEALRLLRRVPELGINFVDTADSYGPDISEWLIREALHPYDGKVFVATKAGLTRTNKGAEGWVPLGRPEYLIQQAHKSLRNLGVERLDLWQLHRIDPKVPADEQFDAIKTLIDQGMVRHAGLSEAGIADIEAASKYFRVATVQNRYNLTDRTYEPVLDYCTEHGIGFIPWEPLGHGMLAEAGSLLNTIAVRHRVTPGHIALAWLLKRSPVILPIPGTSKIHHLEENVAAADIRLSDEEFRSLDEAGRKMFSEATATTS
jgi:pyridoxine 4-dehydrogenase